MPAQMEMRGKSPMGMDMRGPPVQSSPLKSNQSIEPTVHVYHSHNEELDRLQDEINCVKSNMQRHAEHIQPNSIQQSREIELELHLKVLPRVKKETPNQEKNEQRN